MLSPEAEIESLRSTIARYFSVYGVVVSPMALTFQVGVPPGGIDAPFDALRIELVPKDYIPTITQEKGETLVHVQRRPRPRFARTQVNLILLLVTVLTTTFFGGAWNWADYSGQPFLSVESIGFGGLFFTLPLLTILGSHEMGHYLVAKRYKVQASLPFFPLPDPLLPQPHPLAFAGWVGLFVTAINLLPAGQLDGGHVARALLGSRQLYLSWSAILILFGLSLFYPGWFLFGFLIFILGVRHPPPLNDLTRLDPRRKLIGIAAVVILIVTFVPQPFVTVASERGIAFETTNGTPLPGLNQTIALGASLVLIFAVNNTGPIKESIIMGTKDQNLAAFGFVTLFTSYRIGSVSTAVNNASVTITLNARQRAVFDLQVTAPTNWSSSPLPQYVSFLVTARTTDGLIRPELSVDLRITP